MRNTCPLLSLHLIILEYVSDPFKTEVINHDNAAKFTGLSCKLHIFAYWKCTRNNYQSYRTTAHTLFIISAIYFLLRMHFVDFSRNCFGSFLAKWRRSWWDQSWEACLEMSLWYFWHIQVHEFIKETTNVHLYEVHAHTNILRCGELRCTQLFLLSPSPNRHNNELLTMHWQFCLKTAKTSSRKFVISLKVAKSSR